ncbi:hypothetical protein ASG88_04500 [Nocardioides sp. Soil777]|uniref:VanZ family protein n=1 Tax=Nocardioides sp. Soil777 TaxID=1736409 RepID=UPI000702D99C|nr:VanZ family protein [Nocardioides sp. Soil777]KRF02636.1 hypothetical protein ASG88_04500 [Nocardioides sp. Soil777]
MTTDPRRRWWGLALGLYVVALLALVLAPSVPGPNRVMAEVVELLVRAGVPRYPTGEVVEFGLNIAMAVPLTVLASLLWPQPTWRDWTAWAFVVFGSVEAAQAVLLPERHGSFSDIAANTAGCLIGAIAVDVVRRRQARPAESAPA